MCAPPKSLVAKSLWIWQPHWGRKQSAFAFSDTFAFMAELTLLGRPCVVRSCVQGYLAQKKTPSPKILQQTYAYGPAAVLGGERFLMSGVPL